jgi:NAD(P)-dependent dehydrogenase (short-subunit alcohol dehydrogenase family)
MPDGALVAGGTGVLGEAVVADLLDAGWAVTACDRKEAPVPGGATLVQADLMDPEAARRVVEGVDSLGAVVDLVGGFRSGPLVHETELDDFLGMLRLNLVPAFCLARAAMPVLAARGKGSFVAVSARAALRPFSGAAGYVTGKAAVLAFVQALDADYRDQGVRANAILPSVIDTPANREAMPNADFSRWVAPSEIARVVRFLVSDDASPTSGAAVPVYGRA